MKLNELSNAQTAEIELYYMNYVFGSRYAEDQNTFMQIPTITLEERNRKYVRHETPHEEFAIWKWKLQHSAAAAAAAAAAADKRGRGEKNLPFTSPTRCCMKNNDESTEHGISSQLSTP